MTDIDECVLDLYRLKHSLLSQGIDLEQFHASENKQAVRDNVFNILSRMDAGRARIDTLIVRKNRVKLSLQSLVKLYPEMVSQLLIRSFDERGLNVFQYDQIQIILDRVGDHKREREAVVKGIKMFLKSCLEGVPYTIYMHSSASHLYLQLVDYCSWAVYVKWERGELRPYTEIKHLLRSEYDIFEKGHTEWY